MVQPCVSMTVRLVHRKYNTFHSMFVYFTPPFLPLALCRFSSLIYYHFSLTVVLEVLRFYRLHIITKIYHSRLSLSILSIHSHTVTYSLAHTQCGALIALE